MAINGDKSKRCRTGAAARGGRRGSIRERCRQRWYKQNQRALCANKAARRIRRYARYEQRPSTHASANKKVVKRTVGRKGEKRNGEEDWYGVR